MPDLDLPQLLDAAVRGVGGTPRPGQAQMAAAVAQAWESGEHLLTQAGTGTGKSLAYLVPSAARAVRAGVPVVIATATLALQAQVVDRDLPTLSRALAPLLGRPTTFALVKGRRNYVCKNKVAGGFPVEEDDALLPARAVAAAASRLGEEVVRVRDWADQTTSGDRDELEPGVSERAWRQVSVAARECLGARCALVAECFVEQARQAAREVDVVVTNHAFLAIDAIEGRQLLPEHDMLVIDEAHELVDRVTSTVTDELSAAAVVAAARKAGPLGPEGSAEGLEQAGEALGRALEDLPPGRLDALPEGLTRALDLVRAQARAAQTAMKAGEETGGRAAPSRDGARATAKAAVDEVFSVAERLLAGRELDVAWVEVDPRRSPALRVAPMSVSALLRETVFTDRAVVLTSATLEVGGSFEAMAGSLGLAGQGGPRWRGLNVGSPFDYPRQAIGYIARRLPPPGRDGLSPDALDEIEALVRAAGGRTLGLFSSMRAARQAAEEMRERFGAAPEVLCQGDDLTARLVRRFAETASTCLFGTLSLWQGVDVPGSTCQLVVIDRIPFPRPDDPLSSARSRAVERAGGNGFMSVSAAHAALLLAQGAGRLVRRADDRGVVAFLDSRLATARYAGYLQASLPPFWPTSDRQVALAALRRLDAVAPPTLPAPEPGARASGTSSGAAATSSRAPAPESARTAVTLGHAWTLDQEAQLRHGVGAGHSPDVLAGRLGVAVDVVRAGLARLGLAGPGAP